MKVFYEYVIKDNAVVQNEYEINIKDGLYIVNSSKGNRRFVRKSEFEQVNRNRIYSYEDNLPKYQKILIDDYEERVNAAKAKLKQQEKILKQLKRNL